MISICGLISRLLLDLIELDVDEESMKKAVYVVHCVDTEGPLHEPLEATFDRLHHIFHLDLEPSQETLLRLQAGSMELGGGIEDAVRDVVNPHILAYNDTWDKLDRMLDMAASQEFRNKLKDSMSRGWIYNWFCMDHVDYDENPRRRDIGYHNIFDHYVTKLRELASQEDGIHFHFHPHDFRKRAHICATHWWAASDSLYQIFCRRIIDRHWFPSCNRPGYQVNRPDSHWFLEQFIPFDYASLATAEQERSKHFDFSAGRSGDWRRAPRNWQPYHPSHDDYQCSGNCRRWITRCLNIGSRIFNIGVEDIRQAFDEAREGKPVVLSFANHDFRDIREDVEEVQGLIAHVAADYVDVEFIYCEAAEAMREALCLPDRDFCDLDIQLEEVGCAHVLTVRTKTPSFGPQPFLALKTVAHSYHHDNLDFQIPNHEWTYTFDNETFPLSAVEKIGVAVNNDCGKTTVAVLDTYTGKVEQARLNGTLHGGEA